MLPILAWEMRKRGTDAWGATDGTEIIKHTGSVTKTWELPPTWESIIGHTRAATHGTAKNVENAHPFRFEQDGRVIIGVHNGIIRSHTELNSKYDRHFEVDSQHVYAHLIEGRPLKEIEGYGALVWWEGEIGKPLQMYLAKFNMHDLHAALLETGEIVICSQFTPIEEGAEMFGSGVRTKYILDDCIRYRVGWDEDSKTDVLFKGISLPFGATGLAATAAGSYMATRRRNSRTDGNGAVDFTHIYTGQNGARGTDGRSSFTPPWGVQRTVNGGQHQDINENQCFQCAARLTYPGKQLFCERCVAELLVGFAKHGTTRTTIGHDGNTVSAN